MHHHFALHQADLHSSGHQSSEHQEAAGAPRAELQAHVYGVGIDMARQLQSAAGVKEGREGGRGSACVRQVTLGNVYTEVLRDLVTQKLLIVLLFN